MDLLHWRSLTEAVNNIVTPGRILIDKVFKRTRRFASNIIDVDIIEGNKKLAPFVSPIEAGVVIQKLGRKMDTITAPRIRIKCPLNANDFNVRTPGAAIYVNGGDLEIFKQQKIALEQLNLKNQILRRYHWMCAQALTGKIAVSQDNIAFEVDFLFPSESKPVLADDQKWGGNNADITANIREWKRTGAKKGFNMNLAFSTPSATDEFLKDNAVWKILHNNRIQAGQIVLDDVNYIGRYLGVDIFEFNEEYTDESGNAQPMLPDGTFTLVDPEARFDMNYAAIQDIEAGGNVVSDFFSKVDIQKDPSVLWLIVESDGMPTVNQPGAVVHATVK